MKIDIQITFNTHPGKHVIGTCKVNKPSWEDQLLKLLNSITINWDKKILDYEIYAYHSKPISEAFRDKIKGMCNVIYDDPNWPPNHPRDNRISAFKNQTPGDFSLILDTDIIVMKTPKFEFDKEFYAKGGKGGGIDENIWKELYAMTGMTYRPQSRRNDPDFYSHAVNNGVLLISNKVKASVYNQLNKWVGPVYERLAKGSGRKWKKIRTERAHYRGQILVGLIMKKYKWGWLNPHINVHSGYVTPEQLEEVEILHYLGKGWNKSACSRKVIEGY